MPVKAFKPRNQRELFGFTCDYKVVSLDPYRSVLGRPGVRSLLLVTLFARTPITAAPIALTLHVVLDLHLGFARAGLVAAMVAVGSALGAPVLGTALDRIGLRPVLVATALAETAFWLIADHLSYPTLLPAAFLCGLLALPVFTLSRQSLAALLPPPDRQAGFSMDSMSVEVSYAMGPALGVIAVTQVGSAATFVVIAVMMAASGLALIRLDPPVRGEDGVSPDLDAPREVTARGDLPTVRDWFGPRLTIILVATFGATFTLVGTDTALTAAMRSFDHIGLLGLVTAIWCLASLVGGFGYGLSGRRVDPLILLALLAGLTIPLGLAGNWWTLALLSIPTGFFCAPLISSTTEVLTSVTPAAVRGQVMGSHASALTIGNAVGAPITGIIIDRSSYTWGFVGIGVLGLALSLAALGAQAWRRTDRGPFGGRAARTGPKSGRSAELGPAGFQSGHGNAEGRAGHVVQADVVEEVH